MNTPPDLQLQLALAKELPELVALAGLGDNIYCIWKEQPYEAVTPREWDWIVRECEKKLTDGQHDEYRTNIADLFPVNCPWRDIFNPAWQQRALAYFKTIGKEIV